jgi:hypothetical protein
VAVKRRPPDLGDAPTPFEPSEELGGKVREWLNGQGYPLEFRAAQTFRSCGFAVTPSDFVDVPGADSPREIDALAVYSRSMMSVQMRFEFYVECKWSKRLPWVVFASRVAGPSPSAILRAVPTNLMGRSLLWLFEDDYELAGHVPFALPGPTAHGGRVAALGKDERDRDGPDQFYSAMQSVTSITRAGVHAHDTSAVRGPFHDAAFAFSVVVVDGHLFEARLENEVGQVDTQEVSWARVRWPGVRAGEIAHVDVVTAGRLGEYIDLCKEGIDQAYSLLSIAHSDVLRDLAMDSPEALRVRLHGRTLGVPNTFPDVIRGLVTKVADERPKGNP